MFLAIKMGEEPIKYEKQTLFFSGYWRICERAYRVIRASNCFLHHNLGQLPEFHTWLPAETQQFRGRTHQSLVWTTVICIAIDVFFPIKPDVSITKFHPFTHRMRLAGTNYAFINRVLRD